MDHKIKQIVYIHLNQANLNIWGMILVQNSVLGLK